MSRIAGRLTRALVGATLAGAATLAAAPSATAAVAPHLNEIHYDNVGTDAGEAIEVAADPGADLSGWTVVLYNGSGGAPYGTTAVPAANAEGFAVIEYPVNGIQNGSPDGVALVDPAGNVTEFLSYEGTFAAVGGPADGMTSIDIGVAETSSTPVGQSLQLIDGVWTGPLAATFGWANGTEPPPPPPTGCDVAPTHTIGAVQGSGTATPLLGQTVTVRGTVVGDLQTGGFNGYFLQDGGDGDAATSDGVFVYDPDGTPAVSLGDVVQVSGRATEYNGLTEIDRLTEASVCATGAAAPAPAALDLPAGTDDLERIEGMSVVPADELTVTEVYNLNRYGEILLSQGGTLTIPTEIAEPGAPAQAVMAANAARKILLDDGLTTNLSSAGIAPPYLSVDDPVRVGDTLASLQPSVLSYAFGAYRLEPADGTAEGTSFTATNPRPAAPEAVGGDIQVAAFNVLNYFVTYGPLARGAADPEQQALQEAKIVSAIRGLGAEVVGLQEIENSAITTPDTPYLAIQTLVGALNDAEGAPVWDYVRAHEASDVITTGIIYRTDAVAPVGDPMVLPEDAVWDNARDPIAQAFSSHGDVFTVIANHFKSKGSAGDPANEDTGDGQGASNPDRVAQATSLVAFADQVAQTIGDPDVLLVGDFNSYALEDPVDVIRAAGFTDLGPSLDPGDYSYVFNGESGSLDHIFASPSMTAKVTGMDVWNINAVESYGYQYDGFPALYAPYPYRASDHDPQLVGLDLATDTTCFGMPATIVGTFGDDVITGTRHRDVIVGLEGNDVITGLNAEDVICGGVGNDVIFGGNGDDRISGGWGDDVLHGDNGDDVLHGDQGDDVLDGGRGHDILVQ